MLLLQLGSSDEITLSSFIRGFGLTKPRADVGDLNCILCCQKKKERKKKAFEAFRQDMLKQKE